MSVLSLHDHRGSTNLRCQLCPVRDDALCGNAPGDVRREFANGTTRTEFRRGAPICLQGEDCGVVGMLTKGVVKIVHLTEEGDAQILGLLFPGDFVGRVFDTHLDVAYEAATDVALCLIPRRTFKSLLEKRPELEHGYLRSTLRQVDTMRGWTCLLRGRTSRERVAAYLLFTLSNHGERRVKTAAHGAAPVVDLQLSRIDLASALDMTAETLCRSLRGLSDEGVVNIVKPHLIEVTDTAQLAAKAGRSVNHIVDAGQSRAS